MSAAAKTQLLISHEDIVAGREPGMRALAAKSGFQVVTEPSKDDRERIERHYARGDLPTVARDDHRAFLKNLSAIAAGEMIVRGTKDAG